MYLKGSETEVVNSYAQVHSPNACNNRAGPDQSQQLGTQSRSPTREAGTQLLLSHHLLLSPKALTRSSNREQSWDRNPGTPLWDVGILSGFLTTEPAAWPWILPVQKLPRKTEANRHTHIYSSLCKEKRAASFSQSACSGEINALC